MCAPFDIGGGHGSFLKKTKNKTFTHCWAKKKKRKKERKRKTSLWQQRKNSTRPEIQWWEGKWRKNFTHQWDKKKKKKTSSICEELKRKKNTWSQFPCPLKIKWCAPATSLHMKIQVCLQSYPRYANKHTYSLTFFEPGSKVETNTRPGCQTTAPCSFQGKLISLKHHYCWNVKGLTTAKNWISTFFTWGLS